MARRRIATQNSRIGTLDAAGNDSVPSAALFRRVELILRSFDASELLKKALRLFSDKAMPFKSYRTENVCGSKTG